MEADKFYVRADTIQEIISNLMDINAEERRIRSMMIEGPAKRGKSSVLFQIYRILAGFQKQQQPCIICLITSDDFSDPEMDSVVYKLLLRIWPVLHTYYNQLPWPAHVSRSANTNDQQEIDTFLRTHQPADLLHEVIAALEQIHPPILLLLTLDGMDEIEPRLLEEFEKQFIAVLFPSQYVRLLASRRIDSTSHRWHDLIIKLHTRRKELGPFPADASDAQIAYLIQGCDIALSTVQIKNMLPHYSWLNPGANKCLISCLCQDGTITYDDIIQCLKHLMRSARQPSDIDDLDFDRIDRMMRYLERSKVKGVPRHKMREIFSDMLTSAAQSLLGRLQDRGIGYFESVNYYFHREFIELFRELHEREGI